MAVRATRLLRRLAEHHSYAALRDACAEAGSSDPAVQVLAALAEAHLGHLPEARRILAGLDRDALALDARVDLAAVHMALGELNEATATLCAARRAATGRPTPAEYHHALLLARLGWCRLQQGERDEALALYQQSLDLEPRIAVYQNLLRLYRDGERLADMAACLDDARRFWATEQAGWPDAQRRTHSRRLRAAQLDLWLARQQLETAEAWVERQRENLDEQDWCALVIALAERLAERDQHAQAEEWLRAGLGHYPRHLALYDPLATLAQLQGRVHQAVALLRRAINLADAAGEPTVVLWTRLSAAALPWHPGLARQAAEQARTRLGERADPGAGEHGERPQALTEDGLEVELALADVELQEQHYPAAEQRYRRVLAVWPHSVRGLQGLGQLRLQLGELDEAVALFERVKAVDPTRGYGALIHARRFPEDEQTLRRVEALARFPGREGSVRAGLLFALAAAWEQRGAFDAAFALADEANAASRRHLRYDPQGHRQHCARIRHAFPRALYQHRSGCGHDSTLPVFVVGMPRSGTTLVEQILAGHSRIHGAGELGIIPRVIAGLERWERHTGSGRGYPDCVDDLDPRVSRGIAETVLQELREYAPEAVHVVDKLPHNFENIGLIKLLFPRARIVSVRRDPRDVAVSNYFTDYAAKHGGMGFAYHLDWIGEQLADHHLLMHHWQRLFPEDILEIRYEDVVDDPAASARRLLDHLGVSWEPQVLEFATLERPVRTASVWQVRQPLYAGSKARWRHYARHLEPLIAATNRRIAAQPVQMATLPEPGWLNTGVDRYRRGDLDGAEYRFKRLLHHLPEHAAARFLLGLIYLHKGHRGDGIALMEQAVARCPWNRHWRRDLALARGLAAGEHGAVAADAPASAGAAAPGLRLDYLYLSGESTCSSTGLAPSGADG